MHKDDKYISELTERKKWDFNFEVFLLCRYINKNNDILF